MHRVIFDTDLGVDDAHAIVMALLSPDIKVEGITTVFGNARVDYCTQNVLYLLELLRCIDIEVREGAANPMMGEVVLAKPLGQELGRQRSAQAVGGTLPLALTPHGEKGLGDFELPPFSNTIAQGNAIQWMVETVLANPGEIEILALGPLTNIALALRMEPAFGRAVKRVIFMGGALDVPGNVGPLSTANITLDPEAARLAFHGGYPIVMVGQDVTRFARLSSAHKERLRAAGTTVTRFLDDITRFYAQYYFEREPSLREVGHPVHDMLVVAYLLDPSLFTTEKLYVTVETEGAVTRGQTVADRREFAPRPPQMDVSMKVDKDALFELYLDIVTQEVNL